MKRFLSLLLIIALLALPCAGLAVAEADAAPALPQMGDVVHGFEVVETRDYALQDATLFRFEHQKTGAQLIYIANDDTNRAFELGFLTEAIDNTGLPHVFEHATIQGSKKFPGEQMFFNTSYQTYNTFMNAFTGQWSTCYPLASLSEKQLLALAEFYTDACFFPMIMENERIYRTEAWRYRMETPEDDLTIEGTVYSEMLGALSLERMALINAKRAAFPGSMVGNISGGDPDYLPDMTWQMVKDCQDTYYHPSNVVAFLYGQFEDYGAFLELLDGYFSQFERREYSHDDPDYTPITESVVEALPFPVEQGSNTEHASTIFYNFICPGLKTDLDQNNLMNTLTDLLVHNASALNQRIEKELPYASFAVYIDNAGPESTINFFLSHADPEDAETFKAIVDEELADVAANGFPQELVDSVAASLEISAKLTRETSNPVENLFNPMLDYYVDTGNPWGFQDYQDSLFKMDEWNQQGLYAEGVSQWLLSGPVTVLTTTYPVPGEREKKAAELAEKLAELKASMTEEEINAIVEATNAPAPEDHSAEYVAKLKVVDVASLPEEIRTYAVSDTMNDDGVRSINVPAAVDGISLTSTLLDAAGLPQEDIHWAKLYIDLLGQLDTSAHTKAELATLKSRYLYNGSIYIALPRDGQDGYHPYLRMNWIALDDDLDEGYDLVHELLFDTRVDAPDKLLEQVTSFRSSMKSNITSSPASLLLTRSLARTSELYAYSDYATGLPYYEFLGEVEQQLKDDPEAVTAKLENIRSFFNNRANAVTVCAGNAESIALNSLLSLDFLGSLDKREIAPVQYDFPIPTQREALIIDSNVQHNLVVGDLAQAGLEAFDGGLDAITSLVVDTFLVPLLRDQYGVYTPMNVVYEDYASIYAYRDPNIAETFETLETLPQLIRDLELDQDTLDGYIMSAYSGYAMPEGALSGAASAAIQTLEGRDLTRTLEWMRQLKQVTPEAVRASADMYASLMENGARMTGGAASTIHENADLFDTILNPFGAVDKSEQALSDVAEGDDVYEAVRFAFENGFMEAREDGSFGASDPATLGDLAAALMTVIGQPAAADEAVQALVSFGLLDASAAPDAPLTSEECASILDTFTQAVGLAGYTEASAQANSLTRADLARVLCDYAGWLEAQQPAA